LRKLLQAYIRFVQRILVTVLLSLLYAVGFGTTWLLAQVFQRRLLAGSGGEESCWQSPQGYTDGLEGAGEQS
jgi:hypothetical protein